MRDIVDKFDTTQKATDGGIKSVTKLLSPFLPLPYSFDSPRSHLSLLLPLHPSDPPTLQCTLCGQKNTAVFTVAHS